MSVRVCVCVSVSVRMFSNPCSHLHVNLINYRSILETYRKVLCIFQYQFTFQYYNNCSAIDYTIGNIAALSKPIKKILCMEFLQYFVELKT